MQRIIYKKAVIKVTKIEYVLCLGYFWFIFLQACSLVMLLYFHSNVKRLHAVPVINRNPKLQFKILTTSQCHWYLSTIVDTAEEKSSRCRLTPPLLRNSTAVCNELRGAYLADFLQSKFSRTNWMVICRIFPPKFDRFHTTEIYVIRYNSLFLHRTNQRKVKASRPPLSQPCLAQIYRNDATNIFKKSAKSY